MKNRSMKKSIILGWIAALFLATMLLGGPIIQPAYAHSSTFTDVQETDEAHNAIESLTAQGIIEGFADGTFRPNEPLTRAQATKALAIWQDLAPADPSANATSPFTDVDAFYAEYVAAAANAGWVNGFLDGTFRPYTHLTREQMAIIVIRSLSLDAEATSLAAQQVDSVLERFADEGTISPEARPYVALAVMEGLLAGDGEHLNPLAPLTRAQFSLVLYRADIPARSEVSDGSTTDSTDESTTDSTDGSDAKAEGAGETGQTAYTSEEQALAAFMDTYLFRPHNSPITGEMVLQNADWYGIPPLSQLVILAAETSLGDPELGGALARRNNFGCLRYHGASTPWGLLSDGKVWVAGKDWYSFATPQLGMAAFGRYLKAGMDGFYVPILSAENPDWEQFAAVYYGRSVSGFNSYVNRLHTLEESFRSAAAKRGVSF